MPDPNLEIRGGGGGRAWSSRPLEKGGGRQFRLKIGGAPLPYVTSVSNRVTLRES